MRVRRLLLVLALVLVPVLTGLAGFYLGAMTTTGTAPAPTTYPTWTDQEIKGSGTLFVARCTHHLEDGTVRVVESVLTTVEARTFHC